MIGLLEAKAHEGASTDTTRQYPIFFMRTFFISGSNTDVGKTYVTGALARMAAGRGQTVQIVKPYQSGVSMPETFGDATLARNQAAMPQIEAFTLRHFEAALSPLCAARLEGKSLEVPAVLRELSMLNPCDVRIIEGAGGLAVPLDEHGFDWADFAVQARADVMVIVVPDTLGAIHQARVCMAYAHAKMNMPVGIVLNEIKHSAPAVAQSNRQNIADCQVPLWGELPFGHIDIILTQAGLDALFP